LDKARKIGRNDQCPCGSGVKYKRCCMEKIKRKYMAEFALHTYTSYGAICYPHDLDTLDAKRKYHIYMINLIPKLSFVEDSLEISKHEISVSVRLRTELEDRIEKFTLSIAKDIDHTQLTFEFDKPLKSITIKNSKGHGSMIRVLPFYLQQTENRMDCEIIYIGKSFGKNGERNAIQRLKSHSTLQEIQSELLFDPPIKDLAITLWEFTPQLISSFDGRSKEYEKSEEEDMQHMKGILNAQAIKVNDQIINITEAALINYFKPDYNEKFKDNFPDIEHVGYRHYYDLDYNSLLVEIDTDTIVSKIFSKERAYPHFGAIEYNLHPENIRKSMFDIFEDINKNE
jgi:hypothetical protein